MRRRTLTVAAGVLVAIASMPLFRAAASPEPDKAASDQPADRHSDESGEDQPAAPSRLASLPTLDGAKPGLGSLAKVPHDRSTPAGIAQAGGRILELLPGPATIVRASRGVRPGLQDALPICRHGPPTRA